MAGIHRRIQTARDLNQRLPTISGSFQSQCTSLLSVRGRLRKDMMAASTSGGGDLQIRFRTTTDTVTSGQPEPKRHVVRPLETQTGRLKSAHTNFASPS